MHETGLKTLKESEVVDTALVQGQWSLQQGDYDGVIRICNHILRQRQDCREAYLLRGRAFYQKDFFGPAIRDLRIACKFDPRDQEAISSLRAAEALKEKVTASLRSTTEIQGFQVLQFLGCGWEGGVFLVRDAFGEKFILKRFYEYRVAKLNSEAIGFYPVPVAGGAKDLQRLAQCLQEHPLAHLYPLTLLYRDRQVIGVRYRYEKLLAIDHRTLRFSDLRLSLVKTFCTIQSYLLRHLGVVLVDASTAQFMITGSGQLRFIDYGESMNPITDFRCQEEHWEAVTLVNFLYQLFNPTMRHHFKETLNFEIISHPEKGLGSEQTRYPFIAMVVQTAGQRDFSAFTDCEFYDKLGASLPEKLSRPTIWTIKLYHQLQQLKRKVASRR